LPSGVIGVEIGSNINTSEIVTFPEIDCDGDNVKDPLIVILFPEVGSIVFTLNVLIFLYYKITNLEPVSTVIEPELKIGPINNALCPDGIVRLIEFVGKLAIYPSSTIKDPVS